MNAVGISDASDSDISLNDGLNAYEASLESLESFDVYLQVKERTLLTRLPDTSQEDLNDGKKGDAPPPRYRRVNMSFELQDRQRLSEERFRFDNIKTRDAIYREGASVTAWNEDRLSMYAESKKAARISNSGTIRDLIGQNSPPYPLLFKMAFGNHAYADLIRDRDSLIERVGELVRITAPPAPASPVDANVYGITLWLAPNMGYMPIRIEWLVFKKSGIVKANEIFNELEEIEPGLWLPMKSRITFYIDDAKSEYFRKAYSIVEISVDRDRSKFNTPIADEVFDIEFPIGTTVIDEIRQIQYIVGRENQELVLKDLARQGGLAARRLAGSLDKAPSGARKWLIPANILLVALLVIAVVVRRRMQGRVSV